MTIKFDVDKTIWLGQSVRSKFVSLEFDELKKFPIILSLGEAISRPEYLDKFFNKPLKPKFGIRGALMLDSGGFMMMTNPEESLSVESIVKIYKNTDADLCVSLDFPPGILEASADRLKKYNQTERNLKFLYSEFGPSKLIPVVHGRSLTEVESNIEAIMKVSTQWPFIGLGGIVPLLKQKNRGSLPDGRHAKEHIRSMIYSCKTAFPESKLHVFGVGSPATILALMGMGADSVDSVGWRFAANFGNIYLPGTPARFPTKEIIHKRHGRLALSKADLDLLQQCKCPICKRFSFLEDKLKALNASYIPRAAHLGGADGCAVIKPRPKDWETVSGKTDKA